MKKHNIVDVKDYFESFGYKCLEDKYVNNKTKMHYICDKGHEKSMPFSYFLRGNRCPSCNIEKQRHTIEYVKEYFEQFNYICLEDTYINNTTKMKYIFAMKSTFLL